MGGKYMINSLRDGKIYRVNFCGKLVRLELDEVHNVHVAVFKGESGKEYGFPVEYEEVDFRMELEEFED